MSKEIWSCLAFAVQPALRITLADIGAGHGIIDAFAAPDFRSRFFQQLTEEMISLRGCCPIKQVNASLLMKVPNSAPIRAAKASV